MLHPLSTIDAQVVSGSAALLHPMDTASFCTVESSTNVKNNYLNVILEICVLECAQIE